MADNAQFPAIKAIIGLGNPGPSYIFTRHNIGFRIVDALAATLNAEFKSIDSALIAQTSINEKPILLIKPQTFMNASGKIIPYLKKKNIKPEEILVVHDELELPFGTIKIQCGGSHKGHNGLKSIIEYCGTKDFWRLRFGISRPDNKEEVSDYVLQPFDKTHDVEQKIQEAVGALINLF